VKHLTKVTSIDVPEPKPDQVYRARSADRDMAFQGLKQLLGAADYSKAGDRNAGLAAPSETVREAARGVLSELTLQHLHDHPLTDDRGYVDSVMRVNYDLDREAFATVAALTLGELKNHLLRSDGAEITRIGRCLTGVMAAALAKLCDVHELIFIARKINHATRAPGRARCLARQARSPRASSRTTQPTTRAASRFCVIGACRWGVETP
jgi:ethanolamine ammonia-lyase large subunit